MTVKSIFYYFFVLLLPVVVVASKSASLTITGSNSTTGYWNAHDSHVNISLTFDDAGTSDATDYAGGLATPLASTDGGSTWQKLNNEGTQSMDDPLTTWQYPSNIEWSNIASTFPSITEGSTLNFAMDIITGDLLTRDTLAVSSYPEGATQLEVRRSRPYFYSITPGDDGFMNSEVITYYITAYDLVTGTATFTSTSGTDESSVYTQNLSVGDITTGGHSNVSLGSISLVNGSVYTLVMDGEDVYGNDAYHNASGNSSANITFDTDKPTVSSATSSSADDTYGIDGTIDYTLTFSEAVQTSNGTIVVTFNSGGEENLTISSLSTSVDGTYTISEGDENSDLSISSLAMSVGASLIDAASNAMSDFSIPSGQNIGDSKTIVIDGVRPTISSVSSSSVDGSYSVGEQINVTVTFSEAVTLSGGNNLIITLETGTTDRTVTIPATDISNTTGASATYTVQSGDVSTDLAANSITLDGGSLTDGAGNTMSSFNIPNGQNIDDSSDIIVETIAPTIGSVTSSASDGTHGIGASIPITVNFVNGIGGSAEAVTLVGGDMIITLETGTTDQTVTISSISNATSASGTYTVQEGDASSDLSVNSIALSGGATLSDAAGNQMSSFDIPGTNNLDNSSSIVIEATRPTITSVTSTSSDATYKKDDAINITVTFSEAVTLSNGSLEILLETGDNDQTVTISPFTNSTTGSGTYTVQTDDESSDLDVKTISLGAGAILTDVVTNDPNTMSDFTIPVGSNLSDASNIVVDGILPTISSVTTSSSDGYYNTGDDVNITVNFSEAVTLSGGNLIITLETGTTDQQVTITTISSATSASGTYTVQSGDESSDLSVSSIALSSGTLSDAAGNSISDFSIPNGQNLDDAHGIIVDGVVPSSYTVGSVTATGGTSTTGYWNGTNTGISVVVPIESSDASLQGGTVQLQAKVDANSYVDLGASSTITGSEVSAGTKTVTASATGTADTDVEDLTGYGDGGVISIRAIITDIASNSTTGTESATTLTIEETPPTISSVTSSSDNGIYKLNDNINVSVTFSEPVTLSGGNFNVALDAGQTVQISSISSSLTTSGTYTVSAGDETSSLDVNTFSVDGGAALSDAAGNPMSDFSIIAGQNISNSKAIEVDGIVPTDFSVGSVTTVTDPVVTGYWNSSNTAIEVVVPLANDQSLVDGTVQLLGKVNVNSYANIGAAHTITSGEINGNITITVQGSGTVNTDLEELTDFNLSNAVVSISASISDEAGNSTTGTASSTTLTVDQTAPTIQIVGDVTTNVGNETPGYWNSTNTSVSIVVPLQGSDASLENGTIQLRAEAEGTFEDLGDPGTISGADLTNDSKTISVDATESSSTGVEELNGFSDDDVLGFNAIVTDVAGNSTTFTQSNSTLTVDQSEPEVTKVTSSDADTYYKIDDVITITVIMDEDIIVTGTPQLTLETGSTDAVVSYSSGSGTDSLSFSYTVSTGDTSSNLQYKNNTALVLNGGTMRDAAGNDLTVTLPALASSNSLAGNKDIKVDGVVPSDFTIGTITTIGGTVVSGYWNSTNTSVSIVVPLSSDPSLTGGTIQLGAETDGTFEDLGGSTDIVGDSVTAGSQTIIIQATGTGDTDLEELDGYSEDDEITVRAVITDIAGNNTTGSISNTTLVVDETAPGAFTVGKVVATGVTVVNRYWNSTNTGTDITVPLDALDNSLLGGFVVAQARIGVNDWIDIGDITSNMENEILQGHLTAQQITISVLVDASTVNVDSLDGLQDDAVIEVRAKLQDVAGNSIFGTKSDSTLRVDETDPMVDEVTSPTDDGYYNEGDTILVNVIIDEQVSVSGGAPVIELDTDTSGVAGDNDADYVSGSGSDTLVFRYIVLAGDNSSDLDYTGTSSLSLEGSEIIDVAGNALNTALQNQGAPGSLADSKTIVLDTYAPACTLSYSDSLVGLDDNTVFITATMTDFFTTTPTISVDFPETTDDISDASMTPTGSDSLFTYLVDPLPDAVNGTITVTVDGNDKTGNALVADSLTGTIALRIDTQIPVIQSVSPGTGSFVNHTNVGYTIVDNSSDLESGMIVWEAISIGAENDTVQMDADELEVGTHATPALTNNPSLEDSVLYRMIFLFADSAGNQGTTVVDSVTYDTTGPSVSLLYSSYLTREDSTVTITSTFTESILDTPSILIQFGGGGGDPMSGNMVIQSGTDSTVWTFDAFIPGGNQNNGIALITITATDLAQNAQTIGNTSNRDTLFVDNFSPSLVSISSSDSLVKVEDPDTIRIEFNESMDRYPMISIAYADGDSLQSSQMLWVDDTDSTVWTYEITSIPDSNTGFATVTVEAADLAGNEISVTNTEILVLDNIHPVFTNVSPDSNSFINHRNIVYTLSESLESGTITWERTGGTVDPAGTHVDTLIVPDETIQGTHIEFEPQNAPDLVDGSIYTVTFDGFDFAGNDAIEWVSTGVIYDTTGPIIDSLVYSKTPAMVGDTVFISMYFNEIVPDSPMIVIEWPGTGVTLSVDLDSTTNGEMLQWVGSVEGVPNVSGIAGVTIVPTSAHDRAGNAIDSLAESEMLFDSTWVIDSGAPTCSLFYENLSQPDLTNLGRGDDQVRITARFSEQISRSPFPKISITFSDTSNHDIEDVDFDSTLMGDSTWQKTITLPSDSVATGSFEVILDMYDEAGNVVTTIVGESDFNIDNIPPAQFQTGLVIPKGTFAKPGWFNQTTDSVAFTSPIDSQDTTLFLGKLQVRMQIDGVPASLTDVGSPTILTNISQPITVHIRKDTIRSAFNLLDFIQGVKLINWIELFDLAGNSTIGTISTDTLVIDTIPPVRGSYVGGIVFEQDTIISSDSLSIVWSGFEDDVEANESGIKTYRWAIGLFGSSNLDSVMSWTTVGSDTSTGVKETLRHGNTYQVSVFAIDTAGNRSDTLQANGVITRVNSPPVFDPIDSLFVVDEDVRFTYQVDATDIDTATILGDTLHYLGSRQRIPGTFPLVEIQTGELTGEITWTPSQDDTGSYNILISVRDEWGFRDSTNFVLTVNAVNDTPVISQITNMEFDEDDTSAHTLNLTQFVTDVDNNDTTEIFWSYLVTPDTNVYPTYPLLGFGPGMTEELRSAVRNFIFGDKAHKKAKRESVDISKEMKSSGYSLNVNAGATALNVTIDTSAGISIATFVADSNYYVEGRDVIFYATDDSGAVDSSIMAVTIVPINDAPILKAIGDTLRMAENDTLVFNISATDEDDSNIVFTVTSDSSQITAIVQDSVATLIPDQFWVNSSRVVVVVDDGELTDTTMFILDVLRVIRPHINLFIGQNPAFTRYYEIMITDTAEKTISLSLIIKQPEEVPVPLDTVDDYTWVAHYSFDSTGSFQFEVFANAVVGDTTLRDTAVLALARVGRGWSASSADGRFHVTGESGTVLFDQPFMIVDSLLFAPEHQDGGLYRMGHPMLTFKKPVLISLSPDTSGNGEYQAIYQKGKEDVWKEIPTIFENDQLMAWTSQLGYFKIGPQVLIIPEVTALGNNYPNPFNPNTKIVFDVGFFGGPEQKVSVIIYNLLGQEVRMLSNKKMMIGHYEMEWNGRNNVGNTVSSGVYIVRMMTNRGIFQTKKMTLLR